MVITKETIEARAGELEKEANALRNRLNAVLGAMQDCGYWLAQLEKPEQDKK